MTAATGAEAFFARAAERLLPGPPGLNEPDVRLRGDHDFMPGATTPVDAGLLKPAAVLVPVITHAEEATVLLTQRAAALRNHSGQIAFPGGRVDAGDPSPLAAALREAEEEIGLDPRHVRPLGYLDAYRSSTGYFVMPVVALVSPDLSLRLNDTEVADVFEAPLGFLMDPDNHELHAREWRGRVRQYYAIPFGHRYIWGVTAAIIRNLYERLYGS